MIVGYCRVSSREQAVNGESLSQQKARVRPHCGELIIDVESGSSKKRPGMAQVEALIRQGRCEKLVCTRLDRLTRSLGHLQKLIELAMANGCEIVCLDDNFDLGSATGRFHANIIGSVAEMEAAMLSERVRHGTAYRRKQGKANGAPFGYVMNADGFLDLDHRPCVCLLATKEEFSRYKIAQQIIKWHLSPPPDERGRFRRSLERTLSLFHETFGVQKTNVSKGRSMYGALGFSRAGLHTWLANPALQGHTVYNRRVGSKKTDPSEWEWKRNTHEPLVTEDQAKQLKAVGKANFFQGYTSSHRRLATNGLVRCDVCSSICYLTTSKTTLPHKWNYYYRCPKWSLRNCTNKKMVRVEKVENAIVDALIEAAKKIAGDYGLVEDKTPPDPKTVELQQSLAALEKLPFNPAIEQSKAALRAEIRERVLAGEKRKSEKTDRELMLQGLRDRQFWLDASSEDKVELYRYFVENVWTKDGDVLRVELL